MLLPEHTYYDRYSLSSKYYEPHTFYRKHFWCFSTFRTKNIHIYLVLLPEHTCYDRYSLSCKYYEPHAFYRKHFWCFSTLRTKNIHIYLVCCCQRTIAMIDIFRFERYSLSGKNIRAARVSSVAASAHLLRSIFLFEPVLRAACAFYRKRFWCFSTFRTKNTHIYLVCFTYIMFSSSKHYKSHSTVLQSCLLLT